VRILRRATRAVLWLVVTAGGLAFAAVLVYAAISALKPAGEVLAVPLKWWPSHVEWSNFLLPFTETAFARYFLNSVTVGVTVTLLNVVTCTLAGYSFSKSPTPAATWRSWSSLPR